VSAVHVGMLLWSSHLGVVRAASLGCSMCLSHVECCSTLHHDCLQSGARDVVALILVMLLGVCVEAYAWRLWCWARRARLMPNFGASTGVVACHMGERVCDVACG
jgi:hypothetical protein